MKCVIYIPIETSDVLCYQEGDKWVSKKTGKILDDNHDNIDYDVTMYAFNASLSDMNGNDEIMDNLIKYANNEQQFIEIISYDINEINIDADQELREWIMDSFNINTNTKLITDSKLIMLPSKTLKAKIGDKQAELIDCKIVKHYTNSKFALLINKIILK